MQTFYIYGLIANGEDVYAFAEGRIERHDKSPHHILMKKSVDGGLNWSKNQYLVKSENGECFCNPTPVYDSFSGRLHLFYALNDENNASRLFVISSADDGLNWSAPQDLTGLFVHNQYAWTLHLPGPGHGIQLLSGRLVLQVWHRRSINWPSAQRNYGVSVIYSDDYGEIWQTGGTIPLETAQLNESRLVELKSGKLLLNARSGAFVKSARYFSSSSDQGLNWSEPAEIESLPPAFATDAGFVNLQMGDRELLILTRPAAGDERKQLTAYLSADEGASWEILRTIYEGGAGYSDAVVLPGNRVGVLYGRDLLNPEGDVEGNIRRTMFAVFEMENKI